MVLISREDMDWFVKRQRERDQIGDNVMSFLDEKIESDDKIEILEYLDPKEIPSLPNLSNLPPNSNQMQIIQQIPLIPITLVPTSQLTNYGNINLLPGNGNGFQQVVPLTQNQSQMISHQHQHQNQNLIIATNQSPFGNMNNDTLAVKNSNYDSIGSSSSGIQSIDLNNEKKVTVDSQNKNAKILEDMPKLQFRNSKILSESPFLPEKSVSPPKILAGSKNSSLERRQMKMSEMLAKNKVSPSTSKTVKNVKPVEKKTTTTSARPTTILINQESQKQNRNQPKIASYRDMCGPKIQTKLPPTNTNPNQAPKPSVPKFTAYQPIITSQRQNALELARQGNVSKRGPSPKIIKTSTESTQKIRNSEHPSEKTEKITIEKTSSQSSKVQQNNVSKNSSGLSSQSTKNDKNNNSNTTTTIKKSNRRCKNKSKNNKLKNKKNNKNQVNNKNSNASSLGKPKIKEEKLHNKIEDEALETENNENDALETASLSNESTITSEMSSENSIPTNSLALIDEDESVFSVCENSNSICEQNIIENRQTELIKSSLQDIKNTLGEICDFEMNDSLIDQLPPTTTKTAATTTFIENLQFSTDAEGEEAKLVTDEINAMNRMNEKAENIKKLSLIISLKTIIKKWKDLGFPVPMFIRNFKGEDNLEVNKNQESWYHWILNSWNNYKNACLEIFSRWLY